MQLNNKDRKLAEARQAASKLIAASHQLPIDLSLAFEPAHVTRLCAQIIALARQVDGLVNEIAALPQEFRE